MNEKEILEVPIKDAYHYLFSYGGLSPFFKELSENKRFMGAKCPRCDTIWFPPRVNCSKCYCPNEWVRVGSEGEVVCSVIVPTPAAKFRELGAPLFAAMIKLDGCDSCFKAIVIPKGTEEVQKGARVKPVFKEKIESIADFYFEPI